MKKLRIVLIAASVLATSLLAGCPSDADTASENLSTAADNFQINRRVVFYNVYTGDYVLEIDGLCSKGNNDTDTKITITCKTSTGFKKHYLGLTDGLSYFMEQLDDADVSTSHYRVIFKPSTIVPDIQIK